MLSFGGFRVLCAQGREGRMKVRSRVMYLYVLHDGLRIQAPVDEVFATHACFP